MFYILNRRKHKVNSFSHKYNIISHFYIALYIHNSEILWFTTRINKTLIMISMTYMPICEKKLKAAYTIEHTMIYQYLHLFIVIYKRTDLKLFEEKGFLSQYPYMVHNLLSILSHGVTFSSEFSSNSLQKTLNKYFLDISSINRTKNFLDFETNSRRLLRNTPLHK